MISFSFKIWAAISFSFWVRPLGVLALVLLRPWRTCSQRLSWTSREGPRRWDRKEQTCKLWIPHWLKWEKVNKLIKNVMLKMDNQKVTDNFNRISWFVYLYIVGYIPVEEFWSCKITFYPLTGYNKLYRKKPWDVGRGSERQFKTDQNIKNWYINYLWRITYGYQGLWGVGLGSIRLG
jgi:hypothetical protein